MRRLKHAAVLLACVLPLSAGACGGGDDSSSALDAALAYLPADAPFAVALDTDLDGEQYEAVDSLLGKFPLGVESVEDALADQLSGGEDDVDFREDVKPLLGNPFVVGASDASSFTGDGEDDFVAAIQVADADALDRLIDKTKPNESGEQSGATVYEDGGTIFAIEGDVVVFAGSESLLSRALERADGDDHLDGETFDGALDGLPGDDLARVYADVAALLESDPDTRSARKVEWVGALRTLGMTVAAHRDGVEIDFNLRTEGEELSEGDLPIAEGPDSPGVLERDGEVGFGIRDLAQVVRFAEAAGQAIDPAGYGDYLKAKKTLDSRLGISIDDDLIGQFTEDVAASAAVDGKFGLRAEIRDPGAFEETLAKVAGVLPSFAEGAGFGAVTLEKPKGGGDFYTLAQADGDAVVFGVSGGAFVLANDAERARELASAEPARVEGAEGAVAMKADGESLVAALITRFGPELGLSGLGGLAAPLFIRSLEDLTGSIESSTDGLHGRLALGVD